MLSKCLECNLVVENTNFVVVEPFAVVPTKTRGKRMLGSSR